MHYLLFINFFETCNQLLKNYSGFNLCEFPSDIFEFLQVTTIAILHDEVEVVLSALYVVKLDHLRAFNFRQNVDFVLEICEEPRGEHFFLNDLHGIDLTRVSPHVALEDLPKLTLSEGLSLNQVLTYRFHRILKVIL